MLGIDFSMQSTNNQPLSNDCIASFLKDGVQVFVPGSWHGSAGYSGCGDTLIRLGDRAVKGTYVVLNDTMNGADAVDAGKLYTGSAWSTLSFVALDIELPTDATRIGMALDRIKTLNQRPVIYTSVSKWNFGTTFAALAALWTAEYADPSEPLTLYGGWNLSTLAGHQYQGTTDVYGVGVDYSVFSEGFIQGLAGLSTLRDGWVNDMNSLVGGAFSLRETPGDLNRLALYDLFVSNRTEAWKRLIQGAGK